MLTKEELLISKKAERDAIRAACISGKRVLVDLGAESENAELFITDLAKLLTLSACQTIDFLESDPPEAPGSIGYPPVTMEQFMQAQEQVSVIQERLVKLRKASNRMPEEVRDMWDAMLIPQIEDQLRYSEQHRDWMQKAIESQEDKRK